MKKYKVLNKDMTSPFRGFQFEKNKEYHCKTFNENALESCSDGFYATDIDGLPYSFNINQDVWECEVSGRGVLIDQYKQRFENFKLIRKLTKKEIIDLAKVEETKLGYILSEILFPINPLLIKPKNIDYIKLLNEWSSVRNSVWDSVWDSVGDSVGDSVRNSVWDSVRNSVWDSVGASVWDSVGNSVWDSVGASVWDSVGAYISSLFPNIQQWKYIQHEPSTNPFQPCIDLWRAGYVPSFNSITWRLHTGKDAKIIYEYRP